MVVSRASCFDHQLHIHPILTFVLSFIVRNIAVTALSQTLQPICRKPHDQCDPLPPQTQPNQAPNVAKDNKKPKHQKVFLSSSFLSQPKPSKNRTNTAAGILSYAWDVTKYPRLTGSSGSRWMVRGKQANKNSCHSPPSLSDPSFLHACILATPCFSPAFRIQDGSTIRIEVPCLRLRLDAFMCYWVSCYWTVRLLTFRCLFIGCEDGVW